jgi:hypothetical protein
MSLWVTGGHVRCNSSCRLRANSDRESGHLPRDMSALLPESGRVRRKTSGLLWAKSGLGFAPRAARAF